MEVIREYLNSVNNHIQYRQERIKRLAAAIERIEPARDSAAVYAALADISRNSELFAREMRSVLLELHAGLEAVGLIPEYTPLPGAPNVNITAKNGVYSIKMDGMLPFPAKGNVYYLHEKLDYALELYREKMKLEAPIFEERCAVVFIHHYDIAKTRRRYIRDYDNLEYRCVLNALARHFMWDDDPASYTLMHTIAPDNSNFTEVKIMTIRDFQSFAMSEKREVPP